MKANQDWRKFIELLNGNAVDYLFDGAFALAWYPSTSIAGVTFDDVPVNFTGAEALIRDQGGNGQAARPQGVHVPRCRNQGRDPSQE